MTYQQLLTILQTLPDTQLNQDVVIRVSDGEHIPIQQVQTTTADDILHSGHIVLHADWAHTFWDVGDKEARNGNNTI